MRYSTKQVKDSGIFTIFVGGGWEGGGGGGGEFVIIFGRFGGGVRANLPLLRGGYCVIFLLARLISPLPPPDNYCTVPKNSYDFQLQRKLGVRIITAGVPLKG